MVFQLVHNHGKFCIHIDFLYWYKNEEEITKLAKATGCELTECQDYDHVSVRGSNENILKFMYKYTAGGMRVLLK